MLKRLFISVSVDLLAFLDFFSLQARADNDFRLAVSACNALNRLKADKSLLLKAFKGLLKKPIIYKFAVGKRRAEIVPYARPFGRPARMLYSVPFQPTKDF